MELFLKPDIIAVVDTGRLRCMGHENEWEQIGREEALRKTGWGTKRGKQRLG